MGKDDCQPSGSGKIIRITAHQVEVLWEGETARRYRRAQLHNLRHVKLISAAAEPRCKHPNRLESASFVGVCVVRLVSTEKHNDRAANKGDTMPS
jgi:hypothetical protein